MWQLEDNGTWLTSQLLNIFPIHEYDPSAVLEGGDKPCFLQFSGPCPFLFSLPPSPGLVG